METQIIKKEKNILVQSPKKTKGFTLVELIIVITILAILAMIAFISFKSYSGNARDGNRIATLKNIEKWLDLYFVKTGLYPLPEWNILTGSMSGTSIMLSWEIWENIVKSINLNTLALDPTLNENYRYWVTINRQEYNLWWISESDSISQNMIAKTYANSYYGQVIWNYKWYIKYSTGSSHYITNVPSLIYTYNGNVDDVFTEKNQVYFIIQKWENIPYHLSGKVNTEIPDNVIKRKIWKPNAKFENIDISAIFNAASPEEKKQEIEKLFNDSENKQIILESFWTDNEENFQNIINNWNPQQWWNNSSSSSSSSSSWWWNSPSQNNCIANPSFEKDWKIFSIPVLNQGETTLVNMDITENNGVFRYEFTATCTSWVLDGIVSSSILQSCNENYHTENNLTCISNTKTVACLWGTPSTAFSILWTTTTTVTWNGTSWPQSSNWSHSTSTPWACTYQCKAWYYYNGTSCVWAEIWYYVATPWSTTQTACPNWQTTSSKWSTNINQCYVPTFTQICNTLPVNDSYNKIIYTDSQWIEIAKVDYSWNTISGNPGNLSIDGHIVVCGEDIFHRYVLKTVNQWAYQIWWYETKWLQSHGSYGTYYTFWNGNKNDWWVEEEWSQEVTWWSSTYTNQQKMQWPCDNGYHIPTYYEWRTIVLMMWGNNVAASLKLPYAGIIYNGDTNPIFKGQLSYYWSSSPSEGWEWAESVAPSSDWGSLYSWGTFLNNSISIRCFKNQ